MKARVQGAEHAAHGEEGDLKAPECKELDLQRTAAACFWHRRPRS
jgi:hypothetical protein